MAAALQCLSSRWDISCRFQSLSLSLSPSSSSSSSSSSTMFKPLNLSPFNSLSTGLLSVTPILQQRRHGRLSIVCADKPKRPYPQAKRARLAEKRRVRNRAKKSEIRTRMKKVFEQLEVLRKKRDAQAEEILPIEKLIAEAYSAIDKGKRAGVLHRNTAARRKSRLARTKKAVEIHHGWYVPGATPTPTPTPKPTPAPTPTVSQVVEIY